jgi:carbonic anhydrase/acetyltransferase-like protein (isoleucine patch superfamily)
MNRNGSRPRNGYRPHAERMEDRYLLSAPPQVNSTFLYLEPLAYPADRPDTPILPFGTVPKTATFVDPSVRIVHGAHVAIGSQTFVGPYATLNASTGAIKIGSGSVIDDNAVIISNPTNAIPTTSVTIGDGVVIGFGATVLGPSTIGAFTPKGSKPTAPKPVEIGANALIDGATVMPGSIVGALARIGPGVTVPSGVRVLPGVNITTDAEATDPALGKVVPITTSDLDAVTSLLTDGKALAVGYATLYEGNSATGASPAVGANTKVYNGDLATIEGASAEPGSTNGVSFEPTNPVYPAFLAPNGALVQAGLYNFRARVTGQVYFQARAGVVAHHLGHANAIRADEGQPISFASYVTTGNNVTINSPVGGTVAVGTGVQIQDNAVILGGPKTSTAISNNVTVGTGAVINDSSIYAGVTIGARAYISNSTIAANTNVPAGAIIVDNVQVGTIEW